MARILIGNIKGPKGDTGARGAIGPTGPVGPQGPLPPLINNALVTKAGISALDAVMGKTLQDQITQQNRDLKNDSGYTLADGIYTVPANTNADAIIWPGLYYCNGVVIDGSKKWGYMLVMTGASNIKQIYWQNDSNRTIQRRKYSDVWSDWSEYTQKDDLGKAKYVSDLMGAQGVPTLVQWTSDTLNTPYKAGKTTSSHGFAIVYGGYSDNQVIFAMALGTTDFFIHRCSNGTPSGWETK